MQPSLRLHIMTLRNGFAKVGYHLLDVVMQWAAPIRGDNTEWLRVIATTLGPRKSVVMRWLY